MTIYGLTGPLLLVKFASLLNGIGSFLLLHNGNLRVLPPQISNFGTAKGVSSQVSGAMLLEQGHSARRYYNE